MILALSPFHAFFAIADDNVAAQVEDAAGSRVRVVWVQDQSKQQNDALARGKKLTLMGWDSADGKGERTILSSQRSYTKPLLTADGQRIVFSDHFADKVFVVNFNGEEKRAVCEGFALEVWTDPASGAEWVYVARRDQPLENYVYRDVARVRLDDPKTRESVWNQTQISPDNFQLSADGARAAGEFPWPDSGLADLARGSWEKRSSGCWASIAPDNSYRCAVFDGPHRNWQLHSDDGQKKWVVNLANPELFGGFEVFHPRWSNHVRFLAITGPYKVQGPLNRISGGGPEVEVYLAKLSEKFDQVEQWIQVTHNRRGDFYPDVWIEAGASAKTPAATAKERPAAAPPAWPLSRKDLAFVWENTSRQNEIRGAEGAAVRACRIAPRGFARFDRHFALRCGAGWFEPEGPEELAQALRGSERISLELTLTPTQAESDELTQVATFVAGNGTKLALVQKRNALGLMTVAEGAASRTVKLCDLAANQPRHVIVTHAAGEISVAVDGVAAPTRIGALNISLWNDARIVFGADEKGEHNWPGSLERIAVYRRTLANAEVKRHAADSLSAIQGRRELLPVRIEAEVVEATPLPDPQSILPYRRALVVHHVRVRKVLQGEFADRETLVARWAVLDGKTVAGADGSPGEVLELTLEPIEEHRELAAERQVQEVERLDLPLFYDVRFPEPTR